MAMNYLIGIGGTGARVVEATLFLSFAGLGPDHLNIILIDPDEANGNLTRTKFLIQDYKTCKSNFPDLPEDNFLMKTKISTPENFIFSIFKEKTNVKLSDYIHYHILESKNKTIADLTDILFTEEELNTPLNEGFRGHPSIGAVIMSEIPKSEDPWKSFFQQLKDIRTPYEAKIMLVGSLFGGTGSAGIPTLSKILKESEEAILQNENKIFLGGTFILPYFTFEIDEETLNQQKIKMFVTPDNFYIATKAALAYYDTKNLPFDEVYLIGGDSPRITGKFSPGSKTQENLPDFIELISALAVLDFFAQQTQKPQSQKFFYAGYESNNINWNAIPITRNQKEKDIKTQQFKSKLITTTLFSYIISTYGSNTLSKSENEIEYTWYKDHFKKDSLKNPENITKITSLINLSKKFLWWLGSISKSENKFLPFDTSKFLKEEPEVNAQISLLNPEEDPLRPTFILRNAEDRKNENLNFNHLITIMNKTKIKKELSTSTKFIDLFFKAARDFSTKTYNI